jgi:hypothetical protein
MSKYSFTPNTITYSTPKNSKHGKAIAKSKIGVVPHTEYKGHSLEHMEAHYNADTSHLHHHPDVHVVSPHVSHHGERHPGYTDDHEKKFMSHMKKATKHFNDKEEGHDEAVGAHSHNTHLNTYINKTVRESSKPTVAGYKAHLKSQHKKMEDKVKTDKAKQQKRDMAKTHTDHVDANKHHFKRALDIHHHLQQGKNTLVNAMSSHTEFEHHVAGNKTKPEGFVTSHDNKPSKLVDRGEFSRLNFLKGKPGEKK